MSALENFKAKDFVLMFARLGAAIVGFFLQVWAAVIGVGFADYGKACFLFLFGMALVTLSEVGRPIIVNIFNEIQEHKNHNASHNNPTGYL